MKTKALIIAGPTASGKSDFAHKLALKINGAIINCDSVQIYRGIETVSASPFAGVKTTSFDEIDGVPYKLFSILSLAEHLSVADYLRLATEAMKEVIAMGKTPIFVGGTGYYINVLINGISSIPEVSEENRKRARDMVKMILTKYINYCRLILLKQTRNAQHALWRFSWKPVNLYQTGKNYHAAVHWFQTLIKY